MKLHFPTIVFCILLFSCSSAEKKSPYSQQMTESRALRTFLCNTRENQLETARWDYVSGLVAYSTLKAYQQYPEKTEYYRIVKIFADHNLLPGDSVSIQPSNIDDLAAGKIFFTLWRVESEKGNTADATRYKNAATWLRNKLKYSHQRIDASKPAAGRWIHKAIYPNQMWLDGLYMGPALYAEWQHYFGAEEGEAENTDSWTDIAHQFEITHSYTWDAAKELNYHAWAADPDEPNAFWAKKEEPNKGCSPEFWGRGMGWYFAALMDVLEWMPQSHPHYVRLVEIASQIAHGLMKYQDKKTGCWHQLLQYDSSMTADNIGDNVNNAIYNTCDRSNYPESSASSMFTYAYLKGIRLGILDKTTYLPIACKAYQGLLNTFIRTDDDGYLNIISSCASAGLGPARDPSRTGTINYYLCGNDTKATQNEGKAIGSFIMASLEAELSHH